MAYLSTSQFMSRAAVDMITYMGGPHKLQRLTAAPFQIQPRALRQEQSNVLARSGIKDSRQNGKLWKAAGASRMPCCPLVASS